MKQSIVTPSCLLIKKGKIVTLEWIKATDSASPGVTWPALSLPTSCSPLVSLHNQAHYLIRKELGLRHWGYLSVLLHSIQLRSKGRLALLRGHREATALRYKVGCWVGSGRERDSGKLPPVSQVCDVANGTTPEFISQFDSFLPSLSRCSQLDYLCSGFQER